MSERMFIDDTNKVWSLTQIKNDWKDFKESGEIQDEFTDYLNACMTYNNGILTELTEDEKRYVDVTYIYYVPGRYGEVQKQHPSRIQYLGEVLHSISNRNEIVYTKGVNNVIVNDDDNRVIQIGGYTRERGLYCDLY